MFSRHLILCGGLALGFCGFLVPLVSAEKEPDRALETRFVDGLLGYGLFESALFFCEERIRKNPGELGFFSAEEVRILNRWALAVAGDRRAAVLERLERLAAERLPRLKSAEDAFRVQLQQAIVDQTLGERERLEQGNGPAVAPEPESDRSMRCAERCEALVKAIDALQASPEEARQLLGLRRNAEFRAALAWKSLALRFAPEDTEFSDALNRALRLFDQLGVLEIDDPLVWQSRIERIACLRLLGENTKASAFLDRLLADPNTPRTDLVQATAEGIRLFLAQGNLENAIRWAEVESPAPDVPDYDLARLEAFLEQWARLVLNEGRLSREKPTDFEVSENRNPAHSAYWLSRSMQLTEKLDRECGSVWGNVARRLLTRTVQTRVPENAEVFSLLAEEAYRRGDFEEAVARFDLASQAAERAGNVGLAFQSALKAAAVEERQAAREAATVSSHGQAAMQRFRDAARKWEPQPQAENAYLAAVQQAGRLVQKQRLPVAEYIGLLREFLVRWPDSPKKTEIARQAARLLEHEGRYQEALEICPEFEGRARQMLEIRNLTEQGNLSAAKARFEELLRENSGDGELQEAYGDWLAARESPEEIQAALDYWRRLEKISPDGSDSNWKAKERIVRLHLKQGNREQAKKMIELFRLLHPEMGSPEQRRRFEEIERELGAGRE